MDYQFRFKIFAEALYDALIDDAFYITMEKSVTTGSPEEAMLRYLDYSICEAEQYGELVIPDNHAFGISVWTTPLHPELEAEKREKKKNFLNTWMGQNSLETYSSIVKFMAEKASSAIPDSAWYLSIIGILPQYQGNGLGMDLVKKVLEKTDQMELPTYLETFTPRNISFYERFGYEQVDRIHEPTTGSEYSIMLRVPQRVLDLPETE